MELFPHLKSRISNNGAAGISCKLSWPEIIGNVITENAEAGVWIVDGEATLHNNTFADNKGPALRNHSPHSIDARENWWGSVDADHIQARIEDGQDNAAWGVVQFDPPLQSAPQ